MQSLEDAVARFALGGAGSYASCLWDIRLHRGIDAEITMDTLDRSLPIDDESGGWSAARIKMLFPMTRERRWLAPFNKGANNEVALTARPSLRASAGEYHLHGDWGHLIVVSDQPVVLELGEPHELPASLRWRPSGMALCVCCILHPRDGSVDGLGGTCPVCHQPCSCRPCVRSEEARQCCGEGPEPAHLRIAVGDTSPEPRTTGGAGVRGGTSAGGRSRPVTRRRRPVMIGSGTRPEGGEMMLGRARLGALSGITAVGVLLAVCSGAAAATVHQRELLGRYQPVTVLDRTESFAPTSVTSFVADANLETQTTTGNWALVTSTPSANELPTIPTAACAAQLLVPCYGLSQRDCSPVVGVASLACLRGDWLSPAPKSVVYARAFDAGGRTVLQYWYFYYDDFYSYNYPPDDFIWQTHEGDWEVVTILVPHGWSHPSWVGYSQHCTGERRAWGDVPRWRRSSHPIVDVAIGSHANYFSPGTHPIAIQCIPPQAVQFLQQNGLALPVDYSHPGADYGPRDAQGVRPTRWPS